MGKNIPIYSINQFKKDPVKKKLYQVEVFDKNRHFQVEYPHRHDNFYEILLIQQGSGSYTIDFKNYELIPDHVYFVSPGQVHSIEYSDDIFGYIFLFTSDFFTDEKPAKAKLSDFPFFQSHSNPPLKIEETEEFIRIFQLAGRESVSEGPVSDSVVRACLDLLLYLSQKYYPISETDTKGKGRTLLKKFQELIEENFSKIHSVKEYASILSISPNHLNETVKEVSGISAKDHIRERQLLEIKRLLSHTDLNISEIADKLGFQDQSYFSRFFRKWTGNTPNQFREQSQIKQ